jgi:hypothetical protein
MPLTNRPGRLAATDSIIIGDTNLYRASADVLKTDDALTIDKALSIGPAIIERSFLLYFGGAVANEKVDIYLAGSPSAVFEITLSGQFGGANGTGAIRVLIGFHGSNAGAVYNNTMVVLASQGLLPAQFAVMPMAWDAGNARWKITIAHRTALANSVGVGVRVVCTDTATATLVRAGLGVSPVYTADTTVPVANVTSTGGMLSLPAGGAGIGGLTIGDDDNLYRSAADTLRTDDALIVGGSLYTGMAVTVGGASTAQAFINLIQGPASAGAGVGLGYTTDATEYWRTYMPAALSGLTAFIIRDQINARTHMACTAGSTTLASRTEFNGSIVVSGVARPGVFTSGTRPTAAAAGVGGNIYDTTLSKPIWSDGSVWRDAAGTAV